MNAPPNFAALVEVACRVGARTSLIAATRLLREHGHGDAAYILTMNIERLALDQDDTIIPPAEQPEPLPVLPETWPFPNSGEGEL